MLSKRRNGCRSLRKALRNCAVCFRANCTTRNFVIMTDQLKTEPIRRKARTIFPATVACSNANVRPPAARICEEKIKPKLPEGITDYAGKEKRADGPARIMSVSSCVARMSS